MSELFPAKVTQKVPAAESQFLMSLEVPREVWVAHNQPAQFVDFVLPEIKPWRATIANRPGRELFDFIIKEKGERSTRIASLNPGDEVKITKPQGFGFPILAYRGHDVILITCGVAIAAMRAVIQEILLSRWDWANVSLFYGERTADKFVLFEEREKWREAGIDIYLSVSRPAEGTYWNGHVGWVQENILRLRPNVLRAAVFVAGRDDMIENVRATMLMLNLSPDKFILNI